MNKLNGNEKHKIAVFDIDGTIFRKNLHFELIDELAWMKIFPHDVRKKLVDLYTSWVEHRGTYESYRHELVELYGLHIKGHTQEEVIRACKSLVPFYEQKTYVFAERLIERLRKEGYRMIAISGSPLEVVKEFNERHLKFDKVYGSIYETDEDGKYTGSAIFEPPHDKGMVIKQYAAEHNCTFTGSYGVGDTESDASFLEIVENPIAFNPNQNLKDIAKRNGWKVIVEKKDVIYDIDCASGRCDL